MADSIRIFGPGAVPDAWRGLGRGDRHILTLAAVMHEGSPVWALDTTQRPDVPGEYRPVLWQVVHEDEALRLDCGCGVKGPCPKHTAADAKLWWIEAHRRDVARTWKTAPPVGERLPFGAEHPKCATREEAEHEARRLGRPFVVLHDGWCRELERREVPRG